MTLLIMPSVVSIPPNISTAAFDTTSSLDRPVPSPAAAAPASSDERPSPSAITVRRLASSIRNACAPAAPTLCPEGPGGPEGVGGPEEAGGPEGVGGPGAPARA